MDSQALLAKIDEIKADFAMKLDEIAAVASGEAPMAPEAGMPEAPEAEMGMEPAMEAPEAPEAEMAPEAPCKCGKKPCSCKGKGMIGKKAPGGDFGKALGL